MTNHSARVRRLEQRRNPRTANPTEAWTAITQLKGNPDMVRIAAAPYITDLQDLTLYLATLFEDRPPPDVPAYTKLELDPLLLLAALTARHPNDTTADLPTRRTPHFSPTEWGVPSGRGFPGHIVGFETWYATWLRGEIAWITSPEPDARTLRERYQAEDSLTLRYQPRIRPANEWPPNILGIYDMLWLTPF